MLLHGEVGTTVCTHGRGIAFPVLRESCTHKVGAEVIHIASAPGLEGHNYTLVIVQKHSCCHAVHTLAVPFGAADHFHILVGGHLLALPCLAPVKGTQDGCAGI